MPPSATGAISPDPGDVRPRRSGSDEADSHARMCPARIRASRAACEGDGMAKRHEEAEASDREARAVRRLLRSFRSSDSYGLVVVMILVTYVMAAALSERWGATILVVVQIGTVWLALRCRSEFAPFV